MNVRSDYGNNQRKCLLNSKLDSTICVRYFLFGCSSLNYSEVLSQHVGNSQQNNLGFNEYCTKSWSKRPSPQKRVRGENVIQLACKETVSVWRVYAHVINLHDCILIPSILTVVRCPAANCSDSEVLELGPFRTLFRSVVLLY